MAYYQGKTDVQISNNFRAVGSSHSLLIIKLVPVHVVVGFYLNFYHYSPESFKTRALRRIEVVSAHFWTSVYLYSKSRSCIELLHHSDSAS